MLEKLLGFLYEGKNVLGWHYLSDLIACYYRTGSVEEASIETSFFYYDYRS
jgi:hypothetical protein